MKVGMCGGDKGRYAGVQCDVHARGARVACARRNDIAEDGGMAASAARAALAT